MIVVDLDIMVLVDYNGQCVYFDVVKMKIDVDYVGSFVKIGEGSLILFGNNSYFGGMCLFGGMLGVGLFIVLGSGLLVMVEGIILCVEVDQLVLGNVVSLSGEGCIDIQVFMFIFNQGIVDGSVKGSLFKQGEGILCVFGLLIYSGNIIIVVGILSVFVFIFVVNQMLIVGVISLI